MADKSRRAPENVPGPFYVDKDCVLCTTCFEIAPEHFALAAGETHRFVARQPTTVAEREKCAAARDACPMGAIGDDGEEDSGGLGAD